MLYEHSEFSELNWVVLLGTRKGTVTIYTTYIASWSTHSVNENSLPVILGIKVREMFDDVLCRDYKNAFFCSGISGAG